jgi:hypothetical protein
MNKNHSGHANPSHLINFETDVSLYKAGFEYLSTTNNIMLTRKREKNKNDIYTQ